MELLRTIGVWAAGIAGALLCCGGLDCLWDGWRDMRRGASAHDRTVGLYVALAGLGMLIAGGLLLWGFYAWRK